MKATLEFNLQEDSIEFEDACNGTKWKLAMGELREKIREKIKYGDLPDAEHGAWEQIRELMFTIITDAGLDPNY